MCFKRLSEFKSRIDYWVACNIGGYYPKLEEIQNNEIRRLARQLKAKSHRETLTNLLDWQERNIKFWNERHPTVWVLIYVYIILLAIYIIFFLGYSLSRILVMLNISTAVLWFSQTAGCFFVTWVAMLVSSTATTFAIMIFILHYNRKIPWKEILEATKNVLIPSISMDFLLKNRFGVSRDFAKLTACLLLNLYPDAEIYFASAPAHVATGIKIENILYMLDQRLPILTKKRWDVYRKPKKSHKIKKFENFKNYIECKNSTIPQDESEQNLENLNNRMTALLNVKEKSDNHKITFQKEFRWENGRILYEDNELVNYSVARFLKRRISDEMLDIKEIAKIDVSFDEKKKDDLIFQVSFISNKDLM